MLLLWIADHIEQNAADYAALESHARATARTSRSMRLRTTRWSAMLW